MNRLQEILTQWHEAHRAQFVRDGYTNLLESFDVQEKKRATVGQKYTRLDVGGSGAWLLEISTGIIFGILGYGKIDRKKIAGDINDLTLDGAVLHRDRFRRGRFDNRRHSLCPSCRKEISWTAKDGYRHVLPAGCTLNDDQLQEVWPS